MADRFEEVSLVLEGHVERFFTDGLIEWSAAGNLALQNTPMPQEEDSILYWVIALAGNMLWAATVYMKPNPTTGLPSAAQKTLSLIGAGFGSDTVRQVKNLLATAPEPNHAKDFFAKIIDLRADQIEVDLVNETAEFVRKDFIEELSRKMKEKWWNANPKAKTPASDDWSYNQIEHWTAIEQNAGRYYVYENFVFPGLLLDKNYKMEYKPGIMRQTLSSEMTAQTTQALASYKDQYAQWRAKINRQADLDSRKRLAPGSPNRPPIELRVPFEPDINFGGRYFWTPAGNLTAGQVVRKWQYGTDKA
jgi:hypothetical protein